MRAYWCVLLAMCSEENGFEETTHIVESVSWDDLERYAASKAGGSSERHHSWRSHHQHDSSRKGIRTH